MPQTGWLVNRRNLFLCLEPESLRSGFQHGWVLARALFREDFSSCPPSHGGKQREEAAFSWLLWGHESHSWGLHSHAPTNFSYLPKPHPLIPSHQEVRSQHMNGAGSGDSVDTSIQSITGRQIIKSHKGKMIQVTHASERKFPLLQDEGGGNLTEAGSQEKCFWKCKAELEKNNKTHFRLRIRLGGVRGCREREVLDQESAYTEALLGGRGHGHRGITSVMTRKQDQQRVLQRQNGGRADSPLLHQDLASHCWVCFSS